MEQSRGEKETGKGIAAEFFTRKKHYRDLSGEKLGRGIRQGRNERWGSWVRSGECSSLLKTEKERCDTERGGAIEGALQGVS